MELSPESHDFDWLVVDNLTGFLVDCLNAHVLDILSDLLGEGYLRAAGLSHDWGQGCRLQLLHLWEAEHYRRANQLRVNGIECVCTNRGVGEIFRAGFVLADQGSESQFCFC